MSVSNVNIDALKAEIHAALVSQKGNALPLALRLAWHGAGTYSAQDQTGGLNGATMRFSPELSDGANAGLHIAIGIMNSIKARHPEISNADLWAVGGCAAIEFMGGPKINVSLGRSDAADATKCPAIGRLPDAAQGAQHIRDVFYRMGFNDQEIVALIGAHTVGSCHRTRSGFEGFWTRNPYKFDNAFFKLLLGMEWVPRKWDGPLQFEDEDTGELMMLPADMAIKSDPEFRKHAEVYAKDEAKFFEDFAHAFAKLISLGLPKELHTVYDGPEFAAPRYTGDAKEKQAQRFLEHAAEGNLDGFKELIDSKKACVQIRESTSARTSIHKAAYSGHENIITYALTQAGPAARGLVNAQDFDGETALFDAVRNNNKTCAQALLKFGADVAILNKAGLSAYDVAIRSGNTEVAELVKHKPRL